MQEVRRTQAGEEMVPQDPTCGPSGSEATGSVSNPREERDPATVRRGLAVTDHHRRS